MQNVHGKEIDLLRTTVKVPGKRLPRATPAAAPGTSPRANGLALERSNTQLGGGAGELAAAAGGTWRAPPLWKSGERWPGAQGGGRDRASLPGRSSGLQTRVPGAPWRSQRPARHGVRRAEPGREPRWSWARLPGAGEGDRGHRTLVVHGQPLCPACHVGRGGAGSGQSCPGSPWQAPAVCSEQWGLCSERTEFRGTLEASPTRPCARRLGRGAGARESELETGSSSSATSYLAGGTVGSSDRRCAPSWPPLWPPTGASSEAVSPGPSLLGFWTLVPETSGP